MVLRIEERAVFHSIGKVIDVKTKSTGLSRSLKAAIIVAQATECGAGQWQAVRFRNGQLTLVAPTSIAAQELVLRRTEILDQINTALKDSIIKTLYITSA